MKKYRNGPSGANKTKTNPNQCICTNTHIHISIYLSSFQSFYNFKMMKTYWISKNLCFIFSLWHSGGHTMPFDFWKTESFYHWVFLIVENESHHLPQKTKLNGWPETHNPKLLMGIWFSFSSTWIPSRTPLTHGVGISVKSREGLAWKAHGCLSVRDFE